MTEIFDRLKQQYQSIALVAGLALTAGCDTEKRITLDEMTLQGPVRVVLVQEVLAGEGDKCFLEVYDSQQKLRAKYGSQPCRVEILPWETRMVHDDGRVYKRTARSEVGYVRE